MRHSLGYLLQLSRLLGQGLWLCDAYKFTCNGWRRRALPEYAATTTLTHATVEAIPPSTTGGMTSGPILVGPTSTCWSNARHRLQWTDTTTSGYYGSIVSAKMRRIRALWTAERTDGARPTDRAVGVATRLTRHGTHSLRRVMHTIMTATWPVRLTNFAWAIAAGTLAQGKAAGRKAPPNYTNVDESCMMCRDTTKTDTDVHWLTECACTKPLRQMARLTVSLATTYRSTLLGMAQYLAFGPDEPPDAQHNAIRGAALDAIRITRAAQLAVAHRRAPLQRISADRLLTAYKARLAAAITCDHLAALQKLDGDHSRGSSDGRSHADRPADLTAFTARWSPLARLTPDGHLVLELDRLSDGGG